MVSYDDKRILCREGYSAAKLLEQAIFVTLTPETTPEQYAAALETLRSLRDRFVAKLDLFHYPSSQGSHQCVGNVFDDAEARLELLAITMPQPKAPPPPTPQPKPRSLTDVVQDFAGMTDEDKPNGE
jgi:hypothetical protein